MTPSSEPSTAFQVLPITSLRESPTNPRKFFDEAGLKDLADSIREQGVNDPIHVRPLPLGSDFGFEIVAGARRFRASQLAGRDTIPALVREMTDLQALELQMTENLQRNDLHPLEEADGYKILQDAGHKTAADIAKRLGKDVGYVARRLKLLDLTDDRARKAFAAGEISIGHALALARIPDPDLQAQAFRETAKDSGARAAETIQRNYMLALKAAPFDRTSTTLVPGVGACGPCPNRTGNQGDLFHDVTGKEICTLPACFKRKVEADALIRIETAKARGQKVIEGAAAKKVMPHQFSQSLNGYVALDETNWNDSKHRTNRQILGKAAPETVLIRSPHDGSVLEVIPEAEFKTAAKAIGLPRVAGVTSADTAATAQAEKKRAKERVKRTKAVLETFAIAIREILLRTPTMMHHALRALVANNPAARDVLVRREVLPAKKKDEYGPFDGVVAKAIERYEPEQLVALLVDCELSPPSFGAEYPRILQSLALAYRIDVGALEKAYENAAVKGEAMKKAGVAVDAAIALSAPKGLTTMAAAMKAAKPGKGKPTKKATPPPKKASAKKTGKKAGK